MMTPRRKRIARRGFARIASVSGIELGRWCGNGFGHDVLPLRAVATVRVIRTTCCFFVPRRSSAVIEDAVDDIEAAASRGS
jgi:hypothetical protein